VPSHRTKRLASSPLHEFLDHHGGAGGTERAAEDVVDGVMGLLLGHGRDDALAGGQTIGLDHDGRACPVDIRVAIGGFGKARPARGGCAAGVADFLGEGLGAF